MKSHLSIGAARRHAINQSLFEPQTLQRAIDRLGFVQADPIRAPARAQDLILRGLTGGQLKPVIARAFPLAEIVAAHRYLESNQQVGKVVVTV